MALDQRETFLGCQKGVTGEYNAVGDAGNSKNREKGEKGDPASSRPSATNFSPLRGGVEIAGSIYRNGDKGKEWLLKQNITRHKSGGPVASELHTIRKGQNARGKTVLNQRWAESLTLNSKRKGVVDRGIHQPKKGR